MTKGLGLRPQTSGNHAYGCRLTVSPSALRSGLSHWLRVCPHFIISTQVRVEPPLSAHNMTLPALLLSAGACITVSAAIDRYLLPAGGSAANPPAVVVFVDR